MNMKTIFRAFVGLLILLSAAGTLHAQKNKKSNPRVLGRYEAPPVICHFDEEPANTKVLMPEGILEAIKNGRVEERSSLIPIYSANYPGEAKPAMELALQIWGAFLPSDVPIYVNVFYDEQNEGVLASAGPNGFYAIQDGPKQAFYAAPLAEKILGETINSDGEPDIFILVGDRNDWYFGLDGQGPGLQFDLVTILLHELGHGLGFTGSAAMNGTFGTLGGATTAAPDVRLPYAYDSFVELGDGTPIFDLENDSRELGDALTGGDLFFNGPILQGTFGDRAKLFAPSPFQQGSSFSHLDEFAFPSGGENSLMSPSAAPGEVVQVPGITFDIFADMGWILTRILHDPQGDTENSTNPYALTAIIDSDTTYFSDQVFLTYSYDEFETSETVQMTPTGNEDEFAGEIPANGTDLTIQYYISVLDETQRTFTSPGAAPESRVHSFSVGNDNIDPEIIHNPIPFILTSATSVDVIAGVSDNLDVLPNATIEYSINRVEQTPIVMTVDASPRLPFIDQTYSAPFTFQAGDLNEGDDFQYRIVVVDASQNANTVVSPATGFHQVDIVGVSEVVDEYTNDFEDPATADDFIGEDFIFDQPAGFDDVALHSPHPYPFTGTEETINIIHQLKTPIRVKEDFGSSTLSFNEIVLVEPGEPNTSFGDPEFWDYVIVEGSSDNGTTWLPLLDGYDCQADRTWESTYRGGIQGNDSQAEGNEGLFRERTINLQSTFAAGEEILIRFRLFSDPFAVGWGWAIDDLRIQVAPELDIPEALPATDVEATQFRANWRGIRGAESYLLDVSEDPNFGSFLAGYESAEIVGTIEFVTNLVDGETYYYRVRAKAGETVTDFSNVIEVTTGDVATGIEDFVNENEFQIFPNPTSGEILLDVAFVKQAETVRVSVTDILGKQVVNETYQPTGLNWQQRISLSRQSAGMYLVTIEVDGGTFSKKVFLNR